MHEILFRAKRKDNGEWVEGYYAYIGETSVIFTGQLDFSKWDISAKTYAIISETVRQYTGLTDKNGRKIFEGDIVKRNDRIWIVEYDNKYAQFRMTAHTEKGVSWSRNFELVPSDWCEVIGNIYDNPIYDIPELYESEMTAMEKVKVQKVKVCSDCVHEKACQMWNNRRISNKDASCCANFEQRAPVVHGHWICDVNGCCCIPTCSWCGTYVSKCVYNSENATPDYCPNCGAKMDGVNDDGKQI